MLHTIAVIAFLLCTRAHGEGVFYAYDRFEQMGKPGHLRKPLIAGLAEVLWEVHGNQLTYALPVDDSTLEKAVPAVAQELQLYPRSFSDKAGIKQIVLCLKPHTGYVYSTYYVGGLAWYRHQTILLDAKLPDKPNYYMLNDFSIAHGLHHEIFHFIDQYTGPDAEWIGLNEAQDNYVGHNLELLTVKSQRNFVSAYAQTAPVEDEAEVFAFLMSNPHYLKTLVSESDVIKRKVECIKRRVLAYCPEMDEAFWGKINEQKPMWTSRTSSVTFLSSPLPDSAKVLRQSPSFMDSVMEGLFIGVFFLPWLIIVVGIIACGLVKAKPTSVTLSE